MKTAPSRTTPPPRAHTAPDASSEVAQLLAPLAPFMLRLETLIEDQCRIFEPGVAACASYVAGNQGKRLRPALVVFSAKAQDSSGLETHDEPLIRIGAIVEMVHIATLVHDDIMDGASIRRNRLTADSKWGHEISVLLGDCLFAQALAMSAAYPTTLVCRRVAEAANLVCSGEILQTQRRFDLKLSTADYFKIISMKTGALFALACELGAYQAGAPEEGMRRLHEFGQLLGIAYQIYDDCLDLVGTEKEIGKTLGSDLQGGKLTLPLILLLQRAQEGESHLISSILLNEHANSQAMLLDFIHRYDTLTAAATQARDILREASALLSSLPSNPGRTALTQLTHFLDRELARLA